MDVNDIPIVSSTSAERGIVVAKALAVLTFGTRTDRAAARNSCGRILCTKETRGRNGRRRREKPRKKGGRGATWGETGVFRSKHFWCQVRFSQFRSGRHSQIAASGLARCHGKSLHPNQSLFLAFSANSGLFFFFPFLSISFTGMFIVGGRVSFVPPSSAS